MNSHEGQRFKPVDPPAPNPIRLIPTKDLLEEIKRRSVACLLVSLLIEDGGLASWVTESKGTGQIFQDVCMMAEIERIQRNKEFGDNK